MENSELNYLDIWSSCMVIQTENTTNNISDFTSKNYERIDIDDKTEYVFPLNGMPNVILDCVNDLSDVYGSPKDFFSMSSLVACCAAVGKKAILDDGKYKNYPVLWIMNVGPTGSGKSEPIKKAFKPLIQMDINFFDKYKSEIENWKKKCLTIKNTKDYPEKPVLYQTIIDDITPEALYQALGNSGGVTLCCDELSIWFYNIGRYTKSGEVPRYLSIFDNSTFKINRVGSEPIIVDNPYMSIIGGIQPDVLDEILELNQMKNNGLAQRFLFVYPKQVKKKYYKTSVPNLLFLTKYNKLIYYLHNNNFGTLTLSTDAKSEFIRFSNELTDKTNATSSDYLKSLYSKFDIHCLRIALILELIKSYSDNPVKPKVVSLETILYAIEICRYFIYCGLKVIKLGNLTHEKTLTNKISVAKFLVENCGYSQSFVANVLKVSQQYISKGLK